MPEETADKKTRQGISLSPELLASAKVKAGANLSAYVRSLIERDLSGDQATPEATGENILVELAERLRPEPAAMLKMNLELHGAQQVLLQGKKLPLKS